jgi:acetyltransferase-like isoleucine patch superfamily enzyme
MTMVRRSLGRRFLTAHRLASRARAKGFSLLAAGGFAEYGRASVIAPPVRLEGERHIAIGSRVCIGADSWLHVEEPCDVPIALEIGDGTNISGHCVLSAARSVRLGRDVLIARGVYVSDHSHAFATLGRPVLAQGIDGIAPVVIEDGAWLAENVVVCPGVTIGRGAVVGANSVVTTDVPAGAVAVGAPARVVRSAGGERAAA